MKPDPKHGRSENSFNSGAWTRGYVYMGGQLLAVQQSGSISWVHTDPVTKSQRVTDASGNVISTVEMDPWGRDSSRSNNGMLQPQHYTSYIRDGNSSDEAMMRRYNRWHSRFDQPDPFDGSYDAFNPQSFNRYAYTQNDPVNFVDPSGLDLDVPPGVGMDNRYYIPPSQQGWFSPLQLTLDWMNYTAQIVTVDYWSTGENHQSQFEGFAQITFQQGASVGASAGGTVKQAQKQKQYDDCYHEEMKGAMAQLNDLMYQNLKLTALAALPGGGLAAMMSQKPQNISVWGAASNTLKAITGARVGVGTSVSILAPLYNWKRELYNFDRDVFTPAMKRAAENCKKKVGL